MFVTNLNTTQQGKLLAFAEHIINADGVVEERETQVLDTIKNQCSSDVVLSDPSTSNISELFKTHPEKVSLLLELISVALVDEDYHEKEIQIIKEIAEELDISADLQDMEIWVKKQLMLIKEANELMGVE